MFLDLQTKNMFPAQLKCMSACFSDARQMSWWVITLSMSSHYFATKSPELIVKEQKPNVCLSITCFKWNNEDLVAHPMYFSRCIIIMTESCKRGLCKNMRPEPRCSQSPHKHEAVCKIAKCSVDSLDVSVWVFKTFVRYMTVIIRSIKAQPDWLTSRWSFLCLWSH